MVEYARIITKSSEGPPTIPPSASHDNGDWSPNDIYENELYVDTLTGFLYTRQADTIIRLSVDPAGNLVYHDSSMTGDGTLLDPLGLNISTVVGNGLVLTADGLFVDLSGYVPYTGATTDVDLGEHQLKTGQIELDQTPTGPFGVGKMRWNEQDGTAEIRLKGNNVTLQIGQEQLKRVVNKTSPLITLQESAYQAVVVAGAQGQRLAVKLAKADNDANSAGTIGIVTETILGNQEGFITTSGEVRGINTTGSLQGETWADGDILYLSPTTFGALTNIKPTAPNHLVVIGYVEYAHATQGKIFVKVDNGYELEELHNVTDINYTTPQDEDSFLFFDELQQLWKRLTLDNLKSNLITLFNTLYQSVLVSGTNIKTLEGQSLLGSGNIDLTKSDVGLSNVDNTSDLNKPISTATQTALNAKQDLLGFTPENVANKSTSVVTDQASNTKYPSVKSVYDWAVGLFTPKTRTLTINGNTQDLSTDRTWTIATAGMQGVHSLLPLLTGDITSVITGSISTTSTSAFVSQRILAFPYIPNQTFTASNLFINVTTAAASSLCKIGIYSSLNGRPDSLLYSGPTFDCSTTGQKTSAVPFDFVAGTIYWLVFFGNTVPCSTASLVASDTIPIKNSTITQVANATFYTLAWGSLPGTFNNAGALFGSLPLPFIGITKA